MAKAEENYFDIATTKNVEIFDKYLIFLKAAKVKLSGQNICDIGCATGNFISKVYKNNNCFGVDYSDFAVAECQKKFGKIKKHFAELDLNTAEKLPFRTSFDLITLFDLIEHIDNLKNLKQLIKNSLNKKGHLLITTPNANNFLRFFSKKSFTGEIDKTHVNLFSPYTLDFFLCRAGLKKVQLFTPYIFHFKNNWLTQKLLFGGQIVALYKL